MASNNKSGTLRVFLVLAGITVVTLFFVWTRLQNIRLRREGGRLKQREQEVLLENNRLKLEWARLVSPKRLEELGQDKYNLKRPRPEQVVILSEPSSL
ncbi:MAG: cell division protein FtsL [Bdellovibrionota bacterium]